MEPKTEREQITKKALRVNVSTETRENKGVFRAKEIDKKRSTAFTGGPRFQFAELRA